MVTVEKITGGRYNSRATGHVSRGDRVDVDSQTAAYLCDDRGDFERVDGLSSFDGDQSTDDDVDMHECDECGDAFDTPQGLAAHSRSHD